MTEYRHLLAPGNIGDMQLKNRILLSAMGSIYAQDDGCCGERLWDYYEARAKGGAGLLILETSAANWPNGATTPNMVGFSHQRFLPGLSTLTERVHAHGACIAAQLNHGGKASQEDVAAGRPVLVPSIPKRMRGDLMASLTPAELATFVKAAGPDGKGPRYHPMTQSDIDAVIASFAVAAEQAQQANFDAVEIHAAHGYLISSFISPYTNVRDDAYGGSIENRARLLVQVIHAVRARVGSAFPILVRLDAHEYRMDGGVRIEDAVVTARLAEQAGADAIDVSAYGNGLSGIAFTEAPLVHQPGGLLPFARAVKQAVSIPVIGVGRISAARAEQEIAAGHIDFVAMGRKLLADAELPNKLAANDERSVRPCIYCYVCVSRVFVNSSIACAVSPGTGREAELDTFTPVHTPQRVIVVGGGPAGMEAARVLALRGHVVQLWERERDLGGTARIAALPYEPNGRLVTWLVDALKRLPVQIELSRQATTGHLQAARPDRVIIATGATRKSPDIPGNHLAHVFDGERLRALLLGGSDATEAARGLSLTERTMVGAGRLLGLTRRTDLVRRFSEMWMPLGQNITLIGGGLVGLELAEFLSDRGRSVTVLEPSTHLGVELSLVRRARVLHLLREAGVTLLAGASVQKIDEQQVHYQTEQGTAKVAADNVIVSMGAQTDTALCQQLQALDIAADAIGDCADVGYIEGAMLSARRLAVTI